MHVRTYARERMYIMRQHPKQDLTSLMKKTVFSVNAHAYPFRVRMAPVLLHFYTCPFMGRWTARVKEVHGVGVDAGCTYVGV